MHNRIINVSIVTYPRSGSNFLRDYLFQCSSVVVRSKTHDVMDDRFNCPYAVVVVIRDPLDSIVSLLSMETHFFDNNLENFIEDRIEEYVAFYSNVHKAEYILTYEGLVKNTQKSISKLCNLLGAEIRPERYKSLLKDGGNGHVVSSKKLSNYKAVLEKVKAYDLSRCYEIYNKVIKENVLIE